MSTKRKTLRERNAAAIAGTPTAIAEQPAPAPVPAEGTPTQPAAEKPAAGGGVSTVRLGIYFHPEQFDTAKAAYLADWQAGGGCDTFARWIAAALDTHAGRTPASRLGYGTEQGRGEKRGGTRSFTVPTDVHTRMRAAIVADQHAGRWLSDSRWCGEAIGAAVDAARARDGRLPTPPARLPNRLVR